MSKNAQFDLQIPSKLGSSKLAENFTQTQVDHCDFIEIKIFAKFKHLMLIFRLKVSNAQFDLKDPSKTWVLQIG